MKAAILSFVNYILYGNLFVSLCAASLTYLNTLFFELDHLAIPLSTFIFCATNIAYNFQRLFRIRKTAQSNSSKRLIWIKVHKTQLLLINYILSGIAILLLILLPKATLFLLLPIGTISIWYVAGYRNIPALRNIPFVKLFVIGITWSLSTLGLPYFLSDQAIALPQLLVLFFAISLFVIFQTIPFDIRDINYDNQLSVKTLAQRLGIKRSKWLSTSGFILLTLLFSTLYSQTEIEAESIIFLSYAAATLLAIPLILGIHSNKKEVYYSAIIESILLFPFLVHLFLSKII